MQCPVYHECDKWHSDCKTHARVLELCYNKIHERCQVIHEYDKWHSECETMTGVMENTWGIKF